MQYTDENGLYLEMSLCILREEHEVDAGILRNLACYNSLGLNQTVYKILVMTRWSHHSIDAETGYVLDGRFA